MGKCPLENRCTGPERETLIECGIDPRRVEDHYGSERMRFVHCVCKGNGTTENLWRECAKYDTTDAIKAINFKRKSPLCRFLVLLSGAAIFYLIAFIGLGCFKFEADFWNLFILGSIFFLTTNIVAGLICRGFKLDSFDVLFGIDAIAIIVCSIGVAVISCDSGCGFWIGLLRFIGCLIAFALFSVIGVLIGEIGLKNK